MLNFSQLGCFVTVAQQSSFTQAAQLLCISPTAVSKQIKKLEQQLQQALFIRTTRSVKLSEFGELFYQRSVKLLDEVASTEQLIQASKKIPQGNLTVLVSTILSKQFVLKHLKEFVDSYPLIHCELIFSELDANFSRQDLDIMVGFPEIPPFTDNLRYRKMFTVENILCASPTLLAKFNEVNRPHDLMTIPFISHSLRKPATSLPLENGEQLLCPAPLLLMDNFAALNQACIDGIGAFLTGNTLVHDALNNKQLLRLLPNIAFKKYDIFFFYQSLKYEHPKVRAFLDFYSSKL